MNRLQRLIESEIRKILGEAKKKKSKTVWKEETDSEDVVTFVIDNGALDDIFLDKHDRNLDYKDINGDEFYVLPHRDFDRFEDWAISSGYIDGTDYWQVDENGDIIDSDNELGEAKKKKSNARW